MMRYTKNSRSTTDPAGDSKLPFLFLALPVMDEPELLPRLLDCIAMQSYRRFRLFVCVNQPDHWWDDPDKIVVCENNEGTIRLLQEFPGFDIEIIDKSSKGHGWTGKKHGVGFARKTVMDRINAVAAPGDVIVSLDADSIFSPRFLQSVAENFSKHPGATAMAMPYFHNITTDPVASRAMLRYEIYMRHYFLSLHRIGSPYAFTALGSAMAVPVWAYRAVGGMTPKLSGEDFYFLQKLKKFGNVLLWNEEAVNPEARFSDRVFFGTGPAMIKGAAGDWLSYPIYPDRFFDEIEETYRLIPEIWHQTPDTSVVRFLSGVFREKDPFHPLRANQTDLQHFTRAFHEKFDGLRILQYLKTAKEGDPSTDEENLRKFLSRFYNESEMEFSPAETAHLSFTESSPELLEKIRMFLYRKEMEARFTAARG